jgi:hypothetical protein
VLLRLVPPVIRLLLVRIGPLRTGVSGGRGLGATTRWRWRRIPRMVGHVAAVLFSCCGSDIQNNGVRTVKVA